MNEQTNCFKINFGVGYILKDFETGYYRFYHPSNNSLLFGTARLVSDWTELIKLLEKIEEEGFIDNAEHPNTKFRVVLLSNITFCVNKLKDAPLGARTELPNFITQNRGLVNVSGDRNLRFFRTLAVFQGTNHKRCERQEKILYDAYASHFGISEFNSVTLKDFVQLEDYFKINTNVYIQIDQLVHRSRNVYNNDLSLWKLFKFNCWVWKILFCFWMFKLWKVVVW